MLRAHKYNRLIKASSLTPADDLEKTVNGIKDAGSDLAAALVEASKQERSVRHVLDNSEGEGRFDSRTNGCGIKLK